MTDAAETGLAFGAVFMFGLMAGAGMGGCCVREVRRDAVKHGVAEYVADADGNVEFKWKEKRDD